MPGAFAVAAEFGKSELKPLEALWAGGLPRCWSLDVSGTTGAGKRLYALLDTAGGDLRVRVQEAEGPRRAEVNAPLRWRGEPQAAVEAEASLSAAVRVVQHPSSASCAAAPRTAVQHAAPAPATVKVMHKHLLIVNGNRFAIGCQE